MYNLAITALVAALGTVGASERSLHKYVAEKFLASQRNSDFLLPLDQRPSSFRGERVNCIDGTVEVNGEVYNCDGIDFLSFISSQELLIPGTQYLFQSSDIWGYKHEPSGKELTLITMDTGLVIVDSTDSLNPCVVAKSHSARDPSPWGDVKVVGDFAYTIKDRTTLNDLAPGTGMEVYELSQYARMDCSVANYVVPEVFADFVSPAHGSCHNVISNTETGRVYSCGCRETCAGGLVIFDVSENPRRPEQIGCVFQDDYTHDAQCVKYSGPDERYFGEEICFAYNEDTLTIWQVTDPEDPIMLSRIFYENQAYSHQGWLNKDMTKVMLDDELDEVCNINFDATCQILVQGELSGKTTTTTNIFDVSDLENPVAESVFDFGTESIDHNLYVWGAIHERGWGGNAPLEQIPDPNFAYMHNYMAGLRVVDISSSDSTEWTETKFFDITEETEAEFFGAWSGYMHPSGVYALSSIEKGLFFLDTNTDFVDADPLPVFPPPTPNPVPVASPTTSPSKNPTNNPVESPVENPVENPVESPVDNPVPNPVESPVTNPVPSPVSSPVANPVTATESDDESSSASPVLYVFFVIFLLATGGVSFMLLREIKKNKNAPKEATAQLEGSIQHATL